jgi:hypothetical protein
MLIYSKVNVFRLILIVTLFLLSNSSFAIINYQSYLREKDRENGFKLSIEGLFSYYNEQHLRFSGGGVRFNVIDDPIEISIGTSYFFEYNSYDRSTSSYIYTDSGQKSNYHRWSTYLNIGFDFNDTVGLFSTIYFQPSFADFLNYRILNENQLKVNINKTFAIILKLNIYHDSIPPDQVSKTHLRIISGIRVTI